MGDIDISDAFHPFFSLFLFFQELTLTRHVSAVALSQHVLAQGFDVRPRDHALAYGSLNGYIEQLPRDHFFHAADQSLPFVVTLVTNKNPESTVVVARHKQPFSAEPAKIEPLNLAWPRGVISLSHVALPFPPEDPLYGQTPPGKEDIIFLGQMAIQGERGLLKISSDFLIRLRYNPFYAFLETRVLEWLDGASGQIGLASVAPVSTDGSIDGES